MYDDNCLFMLYSPTSRPNLYNVLHYYLFHGKDLNTSDGRPIRPLQIMRSGRHTPDVTIVGGGLVVSSAVRSKLSRFKGVEYRPVHFKKLVDCDYPVGDFSYYDSGDFLADPFSHDPETLIDRLPDHPELHDHAGEHYEIVVPHYEDIKPDRFRAGSSIRVVVPEDDEYVDLGDGPFRVTRDMIQEYPIFQNGDFFVNGECAKLISEFIDSPFYKMAKVV
ncbi:hypothetical protein [Paludisphaera soli]|uniref:hypothetical protein n=1 Tax=Paludisphaera soli TaxID=2712865 RepID=UPI0013E9A92B|nr:hypothetical protein [Paludisphaera soli]